MCCWTLTSVAKYRPERVSCYQLSGNTTILRNERCGRYFHRSSCIRSNFVIVCMDVELAPALPIRGTVDAGSRSIDTIKPSHDRKEAEEPSHLEIGKKWFGRTNEYPASLVHQGINSDIADRQVMPPDVGDKGFPGVEPPFNRITSFGTTFQVHTYF